MCPPSAQNNGKNSGVSLLAQPHGGALASGGTVGNKGGGRRPSAIRKKALRMFGNRLQIVGSIADGITVEIEDETGEWKLVTPKPADRLNALKLLAELGLGEQVGVSEVRERLRSQLRIIRGQATWTTADLVAALAPVWR